MISAPFFTHICFFKNIFYMFVFFQTNVLRNKYDIPVIIIPPKKIFTLSSRHLNLDG